MRRGVVVGVAAVIIVALVAPYMYIYLATPEKPSVWDYVGDEGGVLSVGGPLPMEPVFSAVQFHDGMRSLEFAFPNLYVIDIVSLDDHYFRSKDYPDWCERVVEGVEGEARLRGFLPGYFFENGCEFLKYAFGPEGRSRASWIASLAAMSVAVDEKARAKGGHPVGDKPVLGVVVVDWQKVRGLAVDMSSDRDVERLIQVLRDVVESHRVVVVGKPSWTLLDKSTLEYLEQHGVPLVLASDTWSPPQVPGKARSNYYRVLREVFGTTDAGMLSEFMVVVDGRPVYLNPYYYNPNFCSMYVEVGCGEKPLMEVLAEVLG